MLTEFSAHVKLFPSQYGNNDSKGRTRLELQKMLPNNSWVYLPISTTLQLHHICTEPEIQKEKVRSLNYTERKQLTGDAYSTTNS